LGGGGINTNIHPRRYAPVHNLFTTDLVEKLKTESEHAESLSSQVICRIENSVTTTDTTQLDSTCSVFNFSTESVGSRRELVAVSIGHKSSLIAYQTVPNRCGSWREGAVSDGSTQGAWTDKCWRTFKDRSCRWARGEKYLRGVSASRSAVVVDRSPRVPRTCSFVFAAASLPVSDGSTSVF